MSSIEMMAAGLDWLGLSLKRDDDKALLLPVRWARAIDNIIDDGHILKERSLYGYKGWSAGGSFMGERDDGQYIQVTGHYANEYFVQCYDTRCDVTRIDIQVTVRTERYMADVATDAESEANEANKKLSPARRRRVLLMRGNDGGGTLYIGSATSNQRCRIYNKDIQSEDPQYERCWRYEVIYRNDLADQAAKLLYDNRATLAMTSAAMVTAWLTERGITVPWGMNDIKMVIPKSKTLPSDIERKLKWLQTQVAPTVKLLTDKGYGEDIRRMFWGEHLDGEPIDPLDD